jgi:aspartyl-tRNA(Asn)/glutamyl-tRNA(Gln) amidotransferase subunit C
LEKENGLTTSAVGGLMNRSPQDTVSKMTSKVTKKEVERVAELAHLKLTPEETGSMVHDLNAILDYVAQLDQLDTSSVAPLAQMSELDGASAGTSLREDYVKPSLNRAEVMSQAPESDSAFFLVPKVIER